jgi:hypothetical protein
MKAPPSMPGPRACFLCKFRSGAMGAIRPTATKAAKLRQSCLVCPSCYQAVGLFTWAPKFGMPKKADKKQQVRKLKSSGTPVAILLVGTASEG